jgi:aldehyde:ferredoxin oxidoreductase
MLGAESFPFFEWLNAATGWGNSPETYMEIGARIQTSKQLFNIKQGIRPVDVKMTDRALGRPPLEKGANKGRSIPIEKLVSDYWDVFGWDAKTGYPMPETIRRLGL